MGEWPLQPDASGLTDSQSTLDNQRDNIYLSVSKVSKVNFNHKQRSQIKGIMSDLPELPLFEEIQDISTSPSFFTYTQDEFNKTWSSYETEASSKNLWESPTKASPPSGGSVNSSAKSSPSRDEWDPMLWNVTLTKYVELGQDMQTETDITGKFPELETPVSHLTYLANTYLEQGIATVSSVYTSPYVNQSSTYESVSMSNDNHFDVSGCFSASDELSLPPELQTSVQGSNLLPLCPTFRGRKTTGSRQLAAEGSGCRGKLLSEASQLAEHKAADDSMIHKNGSQKRASNQIKKNSETGPFLDLGRKRMMKNVMRANKSDSKYLLLKEALKQLKELKSVNRNLMRLKSSERNQLFEARQEINTLKLQLQLVH